MNNRTVSRLICCALLTAGSSSLFAQQSSQSSAQNQQRDQQNSRQNQQPGQSSQTGQPSQPGSQRSGIGQGQTSQSQISSSAQSASAGSSMRLSQILGSSVQSSSGRQLGTVRDVTVDQQSGRLEFAILSLSDSSAMGSAAGTSSSGISGSSSQTPPSTSTSYGTPASPLPTGPNDTSRSSSLDRPGAPGSAALPGSSSQSATPPNSISQNQTAPGAIAQGSPSATTGLGNRPSDFATGKLVAVPWQLFSQSMSSRVGGTSTASSTIGTGSTYLGTTTLVLNVDDSKLRNAPTFDYTSWNRLDEDTFSQGIFSHFGVNQEDRNNAIGAPGATSTRGTGAGTSGTSTTPPPTSNPPNQNRETKPQ